MYMQLWYLMFRTCFLIDATPIKPVRSVLEYSPISGKIDEYQIPVLLTAKYIWHALSITE